jgi:hypothetical protein
LDSCLSVQLSSVQLCHYLLAALHTHKTNNPPNNQRLYQLISIFILSKIVGQPTFFVPFQQENKKTNPTTNMPRGPYDTTGVVKPGAPKPPKGKKCPQLVPVLEQ